MPESEASELVDAALDLFVYAPLGLAVGCPELIPDLAERGRNHVRNAQAIGKFAVDAGQQRLATAINDPDSPVGDILRGLGLLAPKTGADADTGEQPAGPAPEPGLPIDGYDDLTAAEIVPLLADLSLDELHLVRHHEQEGRGRKTILGRIGQLERRLA